MTARQIAFRLVAVSLGTLVGLALAGLGVQLLIPPEFMPVPSVDFEPVAGVPYVYRPNLPDREEVPTVGQHHVPMTDNAGFRTPHDATKAKRPGEYRILVVGDSLADTVADAPDHAPDRLFAARLEKKLRARTGRDVEVLDLSAPGLSLAQELPLAEARGIPFDPDLVLFAYCYNDPVETDVRGLRNVEVSGWRPWSGLRRLAEYREVQNQVALWYDGRSRVYHGLETSFDKLAVMGASRRLLLVGMPLLTNDRAAQSHLPVIERLAKERGIPYLDLFPGLAARDLVSFAGKKYPDHIHYNEAGHEAIAELLSAELAETVR
jgi:lysophospholipase L1-like esterase